MSSTVQNKRKQIFSENNNETLCQSKNVKSLPLESRSFSVGVYTALRNEQCNTASEELTIEERYIYIQTHSPL